MFEVSMDEGDSSFDATSNYQGDTTPNQTSEQIYFDQKQTSSSKHLRDCSFISQNTLQNIKEFESHHVLEIKLRLEDEMIKNENLESKLRTIEFDHMIRSNEYTRKIQELELKNSHLLRQIAENEQIYFKHDTGNDENEPMMQLMKKAGGENPEMQAMISELESKLTQYENEILMMKERETDLIGQINQIRQENFDLRLKTERYTFMAQRESHSPTRKTLGLQKPGGGLSSARSTSGPLSYITHNLQINTNQLHSQYQQQQQQQQQRFSQASYMMARVSVLSAANNPRISVRVGDGNVQIDQIQDINEALSMILQLSQDKEGLEQELQAIKEKAINQIISKEQQIIDLIKYHEEQVDEIKRESSRLQLDLQNLQKQDRDKDNQDSNQVIRLQREKNQLIAECQYSEDKYEKLHQKYLEERRQQEKEIAYMQDKYQKDIQFYAQKVDKQKEKNKSLIEELERIRGKLMQQQDFKQEIIKDLEDNEWRLRDAENEKHQLEKDFLYKIEIKNQIIKEKTVRIQELQDQLFNFEDQLKQVQASDLLNHQKQINDIKDEMKQKQRDYEDLEIELENANKKLSKQEDQINDLLSRKAMLNEIINEMQDQKKVVEENHQEKIHNMESQMDQTVAMLQQQINTYKMHIQMLEGGNALLLLQNNLKHEMQEVEECMEEDEGTSSSEYQQQTLNSARSKGNDQVTFNTQSSNSMLTPTNQGKHHKNITAVAFNSQTQKMNPLSLMDELCDDNLQDQLRHSSFQGNNTPYNANKYIIQRSPRYSMMSNSQIYSYQPSPYMNYPDSVRSSHTPSLRNTITSPAKQNQSSFKIQLIQNLEAQIALSPDQDHDQNDENNEKSAKLNQRIKELEDQLQQKMEDILIMTEDIENMKIQLAEKDEQLDEFQAQLEIYSNEIASLKQNKDDMIEEFNKQMHQFQESNKEIYKEIQTLRKQNLQMKTQTQHHFVQLQYSNVQLTQENQVLKRKIRTLENENESLYELMITQKQQSASEKNHLRIQLTAVEDSLIQTKLNSAQVTMDSDLLHIKYKEIEKQNFDLKELISKAKQKAKIAQLEQSNLKRPTRESKNIFTKDRRSVQKQQDNQKLNRKID